MYAKKTYILKVRVSAYEAKIGKMTEIAYAQK